ncbi:hypothetical protein ACFFHH_06715 [Cytobacillus solani]|uniref:Uncharacterized protein n=1 Tax=Cytobacillus solani TaxID=1637975 RepID=A0A0Q3QQI7_9BACI|nr:hypothetical protein [Cytobacillus solani]KOP82966.1 hypothetical protein AMS60_11090 [Bacillus sp. FJAT-21945]KQL19990.1 hypothetical protein AN957_16395 [Cytobacillus solani]USK53233.1 hypothetical protein LIS82_16635 [Cytobacillus solani]
MTKSKAKKIREKLTREGKRNPEENRSPFVFADMRTRKTKTKKDLLYQKKQKNHLPYNDISDGSFVYINKNIMAKSVDF